MGLVMSARSTAGGWIILCLSCCYSLSPPYALSPQTFLYECYLFTVEINKKMFQKSGNRSLRGVAEKKGSLLCLFAGQGIGGAGGWCDWAADGSVNSSNYPSYSSHCPAVPQGCTLRMALFTIISKATGCVGQITPLEKQGTPVITPIYQLVKERAL